MCAGKELKTFRRQLEKQAKLICELTITADIVQIPAPATMDIELSTSLQHQIRKELTELAGVPSQIRRFYEVMEKLCSGIHGISPQAYGYLRNVLSFPSPRHFTDCSRPEKEPVIRTVDETTGTMLLAPYLRSYFAQYRMSSARTPCTLAFDALSITGTGLPGKANNCGSAFAFMMLPLNHRYQDIFIRSIARPSGKINADVLAMKTNCAKF
jgi:hypothetical protein